MSTAPVNYPMSDPAIIKRAQEMLQQRQNGRTMAKLALKRKAKAQALEVNGQAPVASIINFNPVPLEITGGLMFKVPRARNQPPEMQIRLKHKKTEFIGSILTIRSAYLYPRIIDVKLPDPNSDPGDALADYDIDICRPLEQAFHFWLTYNVGATDSLNMGGVIAFEGDKHIFTKALHALQSGDHERAVLRIPRYIVLDDNTREYYAEEVPIEGVLRQTLEDQYNCFERMMAEAQGKQNDPDQRKNITDIDRLWAQYGMDQGWRKTAPEWLNAREDFDSACEGCGSIRTRSDSHFCHKCNRPYDPFKSYMAGEKVDEAYLYAYTGDKLEQIRTEMRRRREVFRDLDAPVPPPPAPPPAAAKDAVPESPEGDTEKVSDDGLHGDDGLEEKTLEELRVIAANHGLKPHHNAKEAAIVKAIREARQKPDLDGVENL